jgi:nucleotide-binding universal stress UspA family protein
LRPVLQQASLPVTITHGTVCRRLHGDPTMNALRQIIVHLTDSPQAGELLRLGAALANRHGAAVQAVYAVDPLAVGAYLLPETANIAMELALDEARERRERATACVADAARAAGVSIGLTEGVGDPLSVLLRASRSADLMLTGQRNPQLPDGTGPLLAGRLLMGVACPLLFVPYVGLGAGSEGAPRCGQRVLVAWSDTRESARALRDALPLLQQAQAVELLRFSPSDDGGTEPLDEVREHLRRHGVECICTARQAPEPSLGKRLLSGWTPDASIAEALLSHAADSDADLIVMGGYGHARALELVLGGVTQTLLRSMTVPVLMSH